MIEDKIVKHEGKKMKMNVAAKRNFACFLFFFIFNFSFLIPTPALAAGAESPLAVLSSVEGKVRLRKEGAEKWKKGKSGEFLFQGDSIKTLKKSKAIINFISGVEIEVNANTEFTIRVNEEKGNRREELDLILGEILSKVQKGVDYSVRTPQAVTAVRGTKFGVRAGAGITEVYVLEGKVDVFNSYGKIVCNPGEKTSVGSGAPEPPEKLDEEQLEEDTGWTKEDKKEIEINIEFGSDLGFIAGVMMEVVLKSPDDYKGKINIGVGPEDFKISINGKKWKKSASYKMENGYLKFVCLKANAGPAVMSINNDDINTLILAVNFDDAKEKKLKLKLDDGRNMELKFTK